jgi:hypothetical protein
MRKDATITVRMPRATRRRLEALAKRESRSLSQQVERLIEGGLTAAEGEGHATAAGSDSLAGLLAREPVPDYRDFRSVRTLLSASLLREARGRGPARR